MAHSIYKEFIDEIIDPAKRLGRHINHDSRSRNYAYEVDTAIVDVIHQHDIPILDQGQLGSCTGNAATNSIGTDPFFSTIPSSVSLNEKEAVVLYSAATKLDNAQGSYPPDDTGSDGLSVAKATKNAGFISGYQNAFSLDAALSALMVGPVITGVNWHSSFDNPDKNGLVVLDPHDTIRGGHEFCILGVNVENKLVKAVNSWGSSWGVQGYFYFSWNDWQSLLAEQGDVTVFVPLTSPSPSPTPTPIAGPTDKQFAQAMDTFYNGTFLPWKTKHVH